MSHTYGTWLPGDPRGFRTRHHREHVDGDYKNPPPSGTYAKRWERSKKLLKREPVFLSPDARVAAVEAIRFAMVDVHRLDVLAIAVGRVHMHVLARFPNGKKPTALRRGLPLRDRDPVRYYIGIAKERSAKSLATADLVAPGGIWAKRGKIVPIARRQHQVRVFHYILDHVEEGAAVWSFRDDAVRINA